MVKDRQKPPPARDNPLRDERDDSADMTKIVSWTTASPKGLHVLANFGGLSSCGKTYSALVFARGLVGKRGKPFLIDTERERALFYSDLAAPWTHGDLTEPFTAERYVAAIASAERAGADAIIIDSASHEWEAEGGVLEQAERSKMKGLGKWLQPKIRHAKFKRALQRSRAHVICCLRAKDKFVQEGEGVTATIERQGIVAVQDPRFIFDATLQLMFDNPERPGFAQVVKCPAVLLRSFGIAKQGDYTPRPIDEAMGAAVAEWCAGRDPVDESLEADKRAGLDASAQGTPAFKTWWLNLPKDRQRQLESFKDNLKSVAEAADQALLDALQADRDATDNPPADTAGDTTAPFARKAEGRLL